MRQALAASLGAHVAVAVALTGLATPAAPPEQVPQAILVDLVSLSRPDPAAATMAVSEPEPARDARPPEPESEPEPVASPPPRTPVAPRPQPRPEPPPSAAPAEPPGPVRSPAAPEATSRTEAGSLPSSDDSVRPARHVLGSAWCPKPDYPRRARLRRQEGSVTLRVRIGADGLVQDVGLSRSSGHALLDRAAADTVATWRFEPALQGSRAVASEQTVQIHFRLE